MRGVVSEAMVMCASTSEKVEILDPPDKCVPGERITFEGYTGILSESVSCTYYVVTKTV